MHIIFYGLLGRFLWGLKQRTNINIKTNIGIASGNNFCATVVTIQPQGRGWAVLSVVRALVIGSPGR